MIDFSKQKRDTNRSIQQTTVHRNTFKAAERTKLEGIETSADVTGDNTPKSHTYDSHTGTVPIGDGGTGEITAQEAIDALTAVSGATNEHVLTKDTATGNAVFKVATGGGGLVSSVFTRTGDVVAVTDDYTWAQIDKTTSDIADITTKSHTSLTDKGTTTHADLDTDHTKLGGIETSADVTDATNIASSIVGVDAKATPVDADTVPLIDSANGNSLKELLWSNVKATLKTYFDTLYDVVGGLATHEADTSTHGVATVAGISETQTLTNKIIELDDALAIDHTYEGTTIDDTVGESVVFGDVLYMASTGKWMKSSSAVAASAEFPVAAMAVATISADAAGKLLLYGVVRDDTWDFTTLGNVYCGVDVPTHTEPSTTGHTSQIIGTSLDADRMIFRPTPIYIEVP